MICHMFTSIKGKAPPGVGAFPWEHVIDALSLMTGETWAPPFKNGAKLI